MEDHRLPTSNPQIQPQPSFLQSFHSAEDDDSSLQQMLSDLPAMSWLPDLSNPNPIPLLYSFNPAADAETDLHFPFLQHHDDIELPPFPSSLSDADGPYFIFTPQGAADDRDSVQALYNAAFPAQLPFQAGVVPPILQTQQADDSVQAAFPAQQPFQATEIPDLNEPPPSEQAPETQTARARTGQAPNPRSVNERQRMVKIAERIKFLQMMFPDANETHKDDFLNEIIEVVKFLQAAVEILSRNTLEGAATEGGAGCSHEGMPVTEQQELVLKLMKEDMGTARMYLRSKGLYLVPVSRATDTILTHYTNGNAHGVEAQPSSSNLPRSTVQPSIVIKARGFVNNSNPGPQGY